MTSDDRCPRCGEDVCLIDPTEEVWSLDPDEFEEDAEVWLCTSCGWNEEATEEETLDEAVANLEWIMQRLAQ